MDPDIRPQDDLFGHVNGRWLDEEEIPADRSSWGPFVQLADQAEQHVHAIIEELARQGWRRPGLDEDRRPLPLASWTRSRSRPRARSRSGRCSRRPPTLRDVRDLAAFLGDFERNGGGGLFASYVDNDDRNAERNIVYVRQGGLGPAGRDLLPRRQVRRDPREVRRAPRAACSASSGTTTRPAPPRPCCALETRLAEGHWERAATRDVIKTYNLKTLAELKDALPGLRLGRLGPQPRRQPRHARRGRASGSRRTSRTSRTCSTETPIEDWRTWMAAQVVRAAAPYLSERVRRGELRLLRPHPQRHARAAGPLEARRRAGRGRDRRGRRPRVRRAALPAALQGDDGRAGRQPDRGLPPLDHRPRLDERGDQAAGVREARHLPPKIGYPDEVARLLDAEVLPRRPGRQRGRVLVVRDRAPAGARSAHRSTATSG